MVRRAVLLLAALFIATEARAQQRGTDVGGQPARRKLTKMPRLVRFVEAEYPETERREGVSASVVLTIDISATGSVASVSVATSAGPAFDRAATRAASQFTFEPAEVDDKPAPSRITYRYDFVAPPREEPQPEVPREEPVRAEPARPDETQEVSVRGTRARRETVEYSVRAEQAKRVAGTQGDVLKVVQNLPGVSRPPVASGQIVVWGSAPRDTRIYVDGVDIPALYHGSGLRGTISSDLVSTIDLVPGAFGAEYGRGLGGLVRVETRALPKGTHGYIGADTLDASALASTELGSRARIAVAGRQSYVDHVFDAFSSRDLGNTFPLPRYRDAQIKATVDLRKNETLDAVILGSFDALDRSVGSADPAERRVEGTRSSFWRAYARYVSIGADGDSTITPFFGEDRSALSQRFGGEPAELTVSSTRYGLRGTSRSRVSRWLGITLGMDALGTASTVRREGSLNLPAREGDLYVFGQPPGSEYATDRFKTHVLDIGPHAVVDLRFGPVTFTPGVRFDAFVIEGNQRLRPTVDAPPVGFSRLETAIAPRASARWAVTPRFALTAAYGQYHQAPEPEELSAVFGTPELALARATHVTVGESLRITDETTLDVVAFDKRLDDLTVRSRLPNPIVARLLTQNGEGKSYGVQFLLRQELRSGFFGWVSYAISKSERRYEGDETWRRFDFDQPHVLSIVASQEIGAWTVGARFRWVSGNPRTAVIGSVYDTKNDRFDPLFGPQNGIRIPSFWQIDLRVDRAFRIGAVRALAFADLQNVTNRENVEEIAYTSDFRRRGNVVGIPFLAVVGGRLEL
jgi:TonB family protein